MIQLLTKDMEVTILKLFDDAQNSVYIISPFLSYKTAQILCEAKKRRPSLDCRFITRLNIEDMLRKANDINAIKLLLDNGIIVYAVKWLHSKLYLFDERESIVGSANFTLSGFRKNIELSFVIDERDVVTKLCEYFKALAEQCIASEEGVVTSDLFQRVSEKYSEAERRRKKGQSSLSTAVFGATLQQTDMINCSPIINGTQDMIDELNKKEIDVVQDLLSPKDIPEKTNEHIIGQADTMPLNRGKECLYKFEGTRFESNSFHEMVSVMNEDKKIYILNFSKCPKSMCTKMPVYVIKGFYDSQKRPHQVIVGRGYIRAFKEIKRVKKMWLDQYPWMKKYKNYVVLEEFESLNTRLENCLYLEEIIKQIGSEVYVATDGKALSSQELNGYHARRPFMYGTANADQYISMQFDTLVEKYTSTKYHSD